MARCPKCRCSFRVMEDEENMHDCPRCGYTGHDYPPCDWCGDWFADDEFAPYCSSLCATHADLDSLEDTDNGDA